ncbi:MAG: YggS family pyridoxal phosphate-dependent enzyme [Cyclobacteriaceae bacterium]|jgi:pyridoxal phosphate enzyme (YggS family)|nr:YggS family pyridoxal phosphate-dependent enzyme [Flammeovirgaceae bacterium]MCZ8022313.1 YggS family pyridoxal phosphate-dependent enzyme [Cytophagales bacterium]MCZ8326618.1 YggS family pyridoxal phosphate-dependent enzyme [Cyclobacteriaceae bacterium]
MILQENLARIKNGLPTGCRLIAVSKTHPASAIAEAYALGHRIFGENKVQELVPKYEQLPKDIEWHLIGHLQTNKVKYIAPFVHLIHSVDSFKLLEEINKQGKKNNRTISCLLQVYIAAEDTKFGLSDSELFALLDNPALPALENISIKGLMGMASLTASTEQIRKEFAHLKNLFDTLLNKTLPPQFSLQELSMGMSSDYPIAIEQGSTYIRVGSAIFGNRNYTTA